MMIPANPGGGWDTTGRELGKAMIASGAVKNIQYDNKGGAAGAIGLAQFVAASKGDPNALIMGGMVMVGGLIQNKSAVTIDQVTPVARLTSEYEVIVVPANSPIKDMKDLMAKFKANPGSVSWGGGSAGGTDHILAGLLAKEVGVEPGKVNYVPFKGGGEAVAAIIGGHVTVGVSGLSEFAQHIQSGKMRALGVSSAEKVGNIASLKEQGFNVELANWRGIFGAPGISKEQQAALVKAVEAATKHPSWAETLKKQDWTPYWLPGDQYGAFVQAENKRIGEILAGLSLGKK
jgi:putative tricarboxylic transport membrane protein